jgi:hypothetical protein
MMDVVQEVSKEKKWGAAFTTAPHIQMFPLMRLPYGK